MEKRRVRRPKTSDSFLRRVCYALDEHPTRLASSIGVPYKELQPLLTGQSSLLVEMDRDDTWIKIMEYVDIRLGLLLAIKGELSKKLQKDLVKRLRQTERFQQL